MIRCVDCIVDLRFTRDQSFAGQNPVDGSVLAMATSCGRMSTQLDQRAIEFVAGDETGHRFARDIEVKIAREKNFPLWRISSDVGQDLKELVTSKFIAASAFEVRVIDHQSSTVDSDIAYQRHPGAEPSLEELERGDKPLRAPEP